MGCTQCASRTGRSLFKEENERDDGGERAGVEADQHEKYVSAKNLPGPDHFLLQQQHGHASRQQNKPFLILEQNRTTTFGLRVQRPAPSSAAVSPQLNFLPDRPAHGNPEPRPPLPPRPRMPRSSINTGPALGMFRYTQWDWLPPAYVTRREPMAEPLVCPAVF